MDHRTHSGPCYAIKLHFNRYNCIIHRNIQYLFALNITMAIVVHPRKLSSTIDFIVKSFKLVSDIKKNE